MLHPRGTESVVRSAALESLRTIGYISDDDGLFHTVIDNRDLDALLAHCPKLEVLSLVWAYNCSARLRDACRSIRVVMEGMSSLDEVVVDDAPCLERLLFNSVPDQRPIKIVRAPRLEVLGFQLHMLQIGGIVIRAGMKVRANAMVPSLKILVVKVR